MEFLITLLEGIASFISPCILPMLPIYLGYFAGTENNRKKTIINACGFVIGFTIVFVVLGIFASTFGVLVQRYIHIIKIVFGSIIILLGLNFSGIIKLNFLNRTLKVEKKIKDFNFTKSILFGSMFSVGWTPCVGAFLGSALMMATVQEERIKGVLLLLTYSVGLGIPFILSAMLINKLKATFDFIKKHYKIINMISGVLLIVMGILMILGII